MPSKLKSEAARRNGAKSRGPVTEAGKQASSVNSIKHGIHSTRVVLSTENPEQYERLLAAYLQRYQPADPVEEALVVDAVNARWRLQRIQQLETALVDLHVASVLENPELPKDIGPVYVCARAHQLLSDNSRALADLHRHEARLTRTYRRSLDMLRTLQAERQAAESVETEESQNEPTADNPQVDQCVKCKSITHRLHTPPCSTEEITTPGEKHTKNEYLL